MRRAAVAVVMAGALSLAWVSPAAAGPDYPPLDPIKASSCPPDYPCTPVIYYDETYPKRVTAWVYEQLP